MTKRTPPDTAPERDKPAAQPFAPVPRQCARHDGWTPARQKAFIDALCDTGSVRTACDAVGMSNVGAYHLRRQPGAEEFAAAWDAALDHRIEILRDTVMERAIHGTEVPVMSYGKHIGTRRIYNDRLAAFMLRNYDGRMSGGAGGLPLRMKRIVEEAVAAARAEWEAEQRLEDEDTAERMRDHMNAVRARLIAAGVVKGE